MPARDNLLSLNVDVFNRQPLSELDRYAIFSTTFNQTVKILQSVSPLMV